MGLKQEKALDLLYSKEKNDRKSAINYLGKDVSNTDVTGDLITAFSYEPELEVRLLLQDYLSKGNQDVLIRLSKWAGKLNNNQYKDYPFVPSKKISYPLPRDLFARIIGKMDYHLFDTLIKEFKKCEIYQKNELIDAIGYMIFYNKELQTIDNLKYIETLIENEKKPSVLLQKLITVLSGFKCFECIEYLNSLENKKNTAIFTDEINRSLKIIELKTILKKN